MTEQVMIIVGVPPEHLDSVLEAMALAGAGIIGEYTHCSYTSEGFGRFKPSAAANPAYGERGQINKEPEVRVETFCERSKAKSVAAAIRKAHPYEEPVIYILPLLDENAL